MAIFKASDRLDASDDFDEVSGQLSAVLFAPPDILGTPETLAEPTVDLLVELQDCHGPSTHLTVALRELDREHAFRRTELGLERLARLVKEAEEKRDDHIRQVQLLNDGFAQVNWGRGLELSPFPPSCLIDDGLVGDGRTWSDEGSDHQVNDIASPTGSEDDASSWPPSSWSGTHTENSMPDIDTCDMDEILRNMELSDLAAEAEDLHHLLVQDQEEALISGLRALDESLSIALSHSTHAARQLRGIKAAVVCAREAEEDERSARDGIEAWERARMQRGLRGDTAGMEARLRALCKGWEQSLDAWGSRMRDISAKAAEGRRTLVADLEIRRSSRSGSHMQSQEILDLLLRTSQPPRRTVIKSTSTP